MNRTILGIILLLICLQGCIQIPGFEKKSAIDKIVESEQQQEQNGALSFMLCLALAGIGVGTGASIGNSVGGRIGLIGGIIAGSMAVVATIMAIRTYPKQISLIMPIAFAVVIGLALISAFTKKGFLSFNFLKGTK